jgi:vitamin B12 transporter
VKKQQLSKRPRHQANLQLDHQLERWTVGLNTHFRSRTFSGDNFGTKVPDLASVVLFGLGTTYQWDSQIRLQLKVDNLLNRSYQTDYGYRQAGLELMFGIQVAQF